MSMKKPINESKGSFAVPKNALPPPPPADQKPKTIKVISGIKNPNKKKHFAIPVAILKQLDEFSNGGYYLISFSERGQPVMTCHADNAAYLEALKKFCTEYFRSVSKAEKKMMEKSIFHDLITGAMRRADPGDDEPPMKVSA